MGDRRIPPIISPSSVSELPRTFENHRVLADKRLYEIYPIKNKKAILLATNLTTCSLFLELGSRTGLGEGLLDLTVYELADSLILHPELTNDIDSVLQNAEQKDFLPFLEEIQNPIRRQMDDLLFDILHLTVGEREAVYEAVINLVETRLKKAGSV